MLLAHIFRIQNTLVVDFFHTNLELRYGDGTVYACIFKNENNLQDEWDSLLDYTDYDELHEVLEKLVACKIWKLIY